MRTGPYVTVEGGQATARERVQEWDVPHPAQSAEAKTTFILCEVHGRLKCCVIREIIREVISTRISTRTISILA